VLEPGDKQDAGRKAGREAGRDSGYGVFLGIGVFAGLAGGLMLGEPSLGVVLGLAAGGLAALALRFRRSGGRPR